MIGIPQEERKEMEKIFEEITIWRNLHLKKWLFFPKFVSNIPTYPDSCRNSKQVRKLRLRVGRYFFQGFFITSYDSNPCLLIQEPKFLPIWYTFSQAWQNESSLHSKSETSMFQALHKILSHVLSHLITASLLGKNNFAHFTNGKTEYSRVNIVCLNHCQ